MTMLITCLPGPVLRLNPNEIHIDDPDFHSQIFSQTGRWEKEPAYQRLGNPTSHFATLDHDLHRIRRAPLNPFFSKQKIAKLEPVIQRQIDKLCERIEGFATEGEDEDGKQVVNVLNVRYAYAAFTMDVATEYAMAKSTGNLDHPDFNPAFQNMLRGMGPVWHLSKQITWLPKAFDSLPAWMIKRMDEGAGQYREFQDRCLEQVKEIISGGDESDGTNNTDKTHKTIFHEVIASDNLPQADKTATRMQHEAMAITIAGTETTAFTLMIITFHLLKNNRAFLRRLRDELLEIPRPWRLQQLEKLPFLTGIVLEGLRLSYGVGGRLGRMAPDRPIRYPGPSVIGKGSKEWAIPPRTQISMTTLHIHQDPRVWGEGVMIYRPERWLEMAERKRLEKYITSFQRGTRACLGMNLAYAELYLATASIFGSGKFEMETFETNEEDLEIVADMVMPKIRGLNDVRVVVSKGKGIS
jgi:cytochrome P450